MLRGFLCLTVVAACGRFGFDPVVGTGDDGGGDDDGPSVFVALALPEGGEAWSIAQTVDPDRVYVVASGRVFRSVDRGSHWTDCGRESYTIALLADSVDGNIVYAGDETGLFRSLDACVTWERLATTPEVVALAWNGNDILIGAEGLWRYSGTTLTKIPSGADGFEIERIAVSGSVVYATTWEAGVFRSTNGGQTFAPANNGLTDLPSNGIAFPDRADSTVAILQGDGGAFRTTNSGASWAAIPNGVDGRDALSVDPSDPSFVLGATWFGIQRSTDGGLTFDGFNYRTSNMDKGYVNDFAFVPATQTSYAATARGMFLADDHTLAWDRIERGLDAWEIVELSKVPGDGVLYATTPSGLLRSEDNGRTWALETTGMDGRTSALATVHVPDATPDDVWTAGANFLWHSTTQGSSFTENLSVGEDDHWAIRSIRSALPRIWFATETRMWRSDNSGNDWTPHAIGGADRDIRDVLLLPNDDLWVATSDGNFVLTTGGSLFIADPLPTPDPGTSALAVASDGTILTGVYGGVFARSPVSRQWSHAGLADHEVYDLLVDGDRWIAATDLGVRYSDDRGATWQVLPGLRAKRPCSLLIDDNGELLVGTYGYGLFRAPLP